MTANSLSSRQAVAFAIAAITLELSASAMYALAAGFAPRLSVEPAVLLAAGARGAALIHWGSVIDMLGYLCLAPVVLYLRGRYRGARYRDLLAAAGLALVVVGSIGAAAMAVAAPPLMMNYMTATSGQKQAMLPAFATLYRGDRLHRALPAGDLRGLLLDPKPQPPPDTLDRPRGRSGSMPRARAR